MKTLVKILVTIYLILVAASFLPSNAATPVEESGECEERVLEYVTVHHQEKSESIIILFVFFDKDCDAEADIVAVLKYLGVWSGRPEFQFIGLKTPADARETIATLIEVNRIKGRST